MSAFPTLDQVATADVVQCLSWNRRLPSPTNDDQVKVLAAIVDRLTALRDANPAAYTAASKAIGW